jgi:hypothetical protein
VTVYEEGLVEPRSHPDKVASAEDGFDNVTFVVEWTKDFAHNLAR